MANGFVSTPYMFNGLPTIINIPSAGITFFERSVEAPGFSMGGPIAVDTMRNSVMRTQSPKSLITQLQSGVKTAYLPDTLELIYNNLGENVVIQVFWPTGDSIEFFGWIEEFKPEPLEEGKMPLADVKIEASSLNSTGIETQPTFV